MDLGISKHDSCDGNISKTCYLSRIQWPFQMAHSWFLRDYSGYCWINHRVGKNKTMLYIYSLLLTETSYLMPSVGAEVKALPWEQLVHSVENAVLSFSADSHAVINVLNSHSKIRLEA